MVLVGLRLIEKKIWAFRSFEKKIRAFFGPNFVSIILFKEEKVKKTTSNHSICSKIVHFRYFFCWFGFGPPKRVLVLHFRSGRLFIDPALGYIHLEKYFVSWLVTSEWRSFFKRHLVIADLMRSSVHTYGLSLISSILRFQKVWIWFWEALNLYIMNPGWD